MSEIPSRYVELCLRLGRHLDGFVDAYIGPPELRDRIQAEQPHDPGALRDEAAMYLDMLPHADLEPDRTRWLRAQLTAIVCVAERLAGRDIPWTEEVTRSFAIDPPKTAESIFLESHRRLDEALPGNGDLSTRYNAWVERHAVPSEALLPTIAGIRDELRRRAAAIVELPPGEDVVFEVVTDKPWAAFNWFKGDYRSVVEISSDHPISVVMLADLVAHEAYPGHHTERSTKEHLLYRRRGRVETSVAVAVAPEVVITEGVAMNALRTALGGAGWASIRRILEEHGLPFDVEVAEVIHREELLLAFPVGANAAWMLHQEHREPSEVQAYIQEWALATEERAASLMRFLGDPTWRAYAPTYTEGRRLCRDFADRTPDGFRRLLSEQLTVDDIVA